MKIKQKETKVLLDQVSANFKTFTSFKATFTMLMESPATNMKEQYTGDMTAQGDKFKLVLNGKAAKEIYNNGTTLWTYFPGEEVTISDVEEDENGLLSARAGGPDCRAGTSRHHSDRFVPEIPASAG